MATVPGSVDSKGIPHVDPKYLRDYRKALLTLKGKRVSFTVKPMTRSEQANAYYWSTVLRLIAKEQEMTPEDLHDAMCAQFLPDEHKRVEFFNRMTGETLTVETDGRRSSKLTGGPFYDFVERVRLFGAEFCNVITPDPDPLYWRKRVTKETP